jgi:hypothetical protein
MGSAWAYILNVPVSAPALVVYIGLLICSFALAARDPKTRNRAWTAAFALSLLVIFSAIYFTWLQAGVIRSICKFCSAAHLLSAIGALLLLLQMPRSLFRDADGVHLRLGKPVLPAMVALAAFGSLAAGQKFAPRQTNFLNIAQSSSMNFNLRDAPVLGDVSNRRYIVSLFDYTCPDCHEMHALLIAAMKKMNNAFSIVALPLPLDVNCNPKVGVTKPKHLHACDYARLGLSVRRCGEDFFQKYDSWFFGQQQIPTLEQATDYARQLVDKEALDKALAENWADQMIQSSIDIYENNGRWTHKYRLPQIIIGDTVSMGPLRDLDELMNLLNAKLPNAALAHP